MPHELQQLLGDVAEHRDVRVGFGTERDEHA